MTDTIQTPIDTLAREATEEFLHLDPADIIIGSNVRTDLRADHKEFRKSIKERGVLEAVTVYRNEDGQYVLLRGQRRTVTAAEVGTPTGFIPARVVPLPDEADRIGDQMVENIHRAGMRETEIVAGVEQLALIGVSAAQIAKRTSIDRPTVNAALAVTKADQTRNRGIRRPDSPRGRDLRRVRARPRCRRAPGACTDHALGRLGRACRPEAARRSRRARGVRRRGRAAAGRGPASALRAGGRRDGRVAGAGRHAHP
ncbi:hypothetical protein ASH02_13065 [Nocardioides sp. Soil796]|nr:hypothetical protein ASH02_13065 [Nocardioides sp. Soil796]